MLAAEIMMLKRGSHPNWKQKVCPTNTDQLQPCHKAMTVMILLQQVCICDGKELWGGWWQWWWGWGWRSLLQLGCNDCNDSKLFRLAEKHCLRDSRVCQTLLRDFSRYEQVVNKSDNIECSVLSSPLQQLRKVIVYGRTEALEREFTR